jgi:osmoprotectant transport system permease protein
VRAGDLEELVGEIAARRRRHDPDVEGAVRLVAQALQARGEPVRRGVGADRHDHAHGGVGAARVAGRRGALGAAGERGGPDPTEPGQGLLEPSSYSHAAPSSDEPERPIVATARPRDGRATAREGYSVSAVILLADDVPRCYVDNDWLCGPYWSDYRPELTDATVEHLWITLVSVFIGLVVAVPLALLARRDPRLESAVVGGTTIIYTIPSLALFSLLLPFTGLSPTTVVIGLALYSLTILVRNVLAGLRAVPDGVREAARGLGYSGRRMLLQVELPLALPVIMAGLRVATVSTVALATIGSIVSYGGLGDLLLLAVGNQFKAQILAASVLCVALAVLLDLALVLLQRLLTPWTRRAR